MSVGITLTDSHIPPSEQFLEFIDLWLAGAELDGSTWATYGQERPERLGRRLSPTRSHQLRQRIASMTLACVTSAGHMNCSWRC